MNGTVKRAFNIDEIIRKASERLAEYRRQEHSWRRRSIGFELSTVLIAALIALLAGLKGFNEYDYLFSNAILVLAGAIVVVNFLRILSNHKDMWRIYQFAANRLDTLVQSAELLRDDPELGFEDTAVRDLRDKYEFILVETTSRIKEASENSN